MKIEQFEDIEAWQLACELTRILDLSNISRNVRRTKQPTVNHEL